MRQEKATHQLGKNREIVFFGDGSAIIRLISIPQAQFLLLKEDLDRLEKVLKWR